MVKPKSVRGAEEKADGLVSIRKVGDYLAITLISFRRESLNDFSDRNAFQCITYKQVKSILFNGLNHALVDNKRSVDPDKNPGWQLVSMAFIVKWIVTCHRWCSG